MPQTYSQTSVWGSVSALSLERYLPSMRCLTLGLHEPAVSRLLSRRNSRSVYGEYTSLDRLHPQNRSSLFPCLSHHHPSFCSFMHVGPSQTTRQTRQR